jgi:hypothetical protein
MADGDGKLEFIADKVRSSDAPTPEEPSARARAPRGHDPVSSSFPTFSARALEGAARR